MLGPDLREPMLPYEEAERRANAYLVAQGEGGRIDPACSFRNYMQGLWIIGVDYPDSDPRMLDGGSTVIVPLDGEPYLTTYLPSNDEWVGVSYAAEELGLPKGWNDVIREDFSDEAHWRRLQAFLASERTQHEVFPRAEEVFRAFELTSYWDTKVVILGQDPYPRPGHANGLAFSVPADVQRLPGSLKNIFKELRSDVGGTPPSGDLTGWAEQGVLLLNTTLTVRAGKRGSHVGKGWERFTDEVIDCLNYRAEPVVFIFWGNAARKKANLITFPRHHVIQSSHPSGLSAYRGFWDSKPFSEANRFLAATGASEIDWAAGRSPAQHP